MMDKKERAFYLAHATLPPFKRRVNEAKIVTQQMIDRAPNSCLSLSFGKDSVAMCHLVLSVTNIPIIYINCGEFDEFPETNALKAKYERAMGVSIIELNGTSVIEAHRKAGYIIADHDERKAVKRICREANNVLNDTACAYMREHSLMGIFMGLRKSESRTRAILLNARGPIYFAKKRNAWTCCPLWNWSARDVWAYTVKENLPYHRLYDIAPCGREKARKGAMIGTTGERYGRLYDLKRTHTEEWNKLLTEFPETSLRV